MKKNYLKMLVLLVFMMQVSVKTVSAQGTKYKMVESVSQDSLLFMIYGNLNEIVSGPLEKLMNKKLSSNLNNVLNFADEFCFSANRSTIYDCYTLQFKKAKGVTDFKMDSLIQNLELTRGEEIASCIRLQGDRYKNGFLRKEGKQYVLKLYVQNYPVATEIRKDYIDLSQQMGDDYYENQDIQEKLQLLDQEDSTNSVNYFEDLINKEIKIAGSKEVKNPVDVKKIFGDKLKNSSGIVFFDAKKISELPFLFYRSTNYDYMRMFEMINSLGGIYNYFDQLWLGFKQEDSTMVITTIADSKEKMDLYKKLDNDILCRLPAEKANLLCVYNFDLAALKQYIIKFFYAGQFKNETRIAAKLFALAIDDDIINTIGDVALAVTGDRLNSRDIPDFKLALKMPNEQKGRLLLDILCDDVKFFKKESENCYVVRKKFKTDEVDIHLVIDDDIWILGTGNVEALKTKLTKDQISEMYPELENKKLSQYFKLNMTALSKFEKNLKNVEVQTETLDKSKVMTTIKLTTEATDDQIADGGR